MSYEAFHHSSSPFHYSIPPFHSTECRHPICCAQHLSDAQANFPALVATSAVPVLHVCFITHSWLPQGTILVNSCNSGDKCNCQNSKCFFFQCGVNSLLVIAIQIHNSVGEHGPEKLEYSALPQVLLLTFVQPPQTMRILFRSSCIVNATWEFMKASMQFTEFSQQCQSVLPTYDSTINDVLATYNAISHCHHFRGRIITLSQYLVVLG